MVDGAGAEKDCSCDDVGANDGADTGLAMAVESSVLDVSGNFTAATGTFFWQRNHHHRLRYHQIKKTQL